MPGSPTTPGRSGARADAQVRVAFHDHYRVGTRNSAFAARWLDSALPYRRFALTLADDGARLGADADRYSFIVADLHRLLLAGLPAHSGFSVLWHYGCALKATKHNVWTKITRPKYERARQRYASYLTDVEWAVIEPHMSAPKPLGRPRGTDLRAFVDAILSMARTGCQWRLLPKDFPPFTTVQGYFYDWQDHRERRATRLRRRQESEGSGRKRHIVTDTTGSMVAAAVNPADVQDRDVAPLVVEATHDLFPWLRHLFADSAYASDMPRKFGNWSIDIVRRIADTVGFAVLPRRWVLERTLAWLNRNRRLAKDFEASIASAQAWVYVASVHLLIRRIACIQINLSD